MFEKPWSGPYAHVVFAIVLAVLVFFATWIYASHYTEMSVRAEKTAEYHQKLAEQNIEADCLSLEPPELQDCIHRAIASARDHERAEQDLDAQQLMALFTKIMGITAVVGTVLGAISIILIYQTLKSTRDLAQETTRIGEAQVQAHLFPRPPRAKQIFVSESGSDSSYLVVHFDIKNAGITPAYRVVSYGRADAEIGEKVTVSPQDIGPQDCGEATIRIPAESSADTYNVKVYVEFDTVFSRVNNKRERLKSRFDYKVKRENDGHCQISRV